MSPLNPRLYNALEDCFGQVLVANPGQARLVSYCLSPGSGKPRAMVSQSGEEYRVNCPYCRDKKARLYINHQYGEYDPDLDHFNFHLLHCFHNDCEQNPENREAFKVIVYATQFRMQAYHPFPETPLVMPTLNLAVTEMKLPSGLEPVHQLKPWHPAVTYLRDRLFDPDTLGTRWQVSYCRKDPTARPAVSSRLVVPVQAFVGETHQEAVAGWQARTIGNLLSGVPKYLTAAGMPKSRLLYNLPEASRSLGPVFVCEGVTDCWRLGTNAVALFGKTLSEGQRLLFQRHFAGRPIVLFLDQDARTEAFKAKRELEASRAAFGDGAAVVVATLPPGRKDVGECVGNQALALAAAALSQTGESWEVSAEEEPEPRLVQR